VCPRQVQTESISYYTLQSGWMVPLSAAKLVGWRGKSHPELWSHPHCKYAFCTVCNGDLGVGEDTAYESHDILRQQNEAHFYRYEDWLANFLGIMYVQTGIGQWQEQDRPVFSRWSRPPLRLAYTATIASSFSSLLVFFSLCGRKMLWQGGEGWCMSISIRAK
jgi:hypothetical protein